MSQKHSRRGLRARFAIAVGRMASVLLKRLKKQASSYPGHLAKNLDPEILAKLAYGQRILVVTGTNGKTTTCMYLREILHARGYQVHSNASGANLETGLITCLLTKGTADYIVLEVDEACFARTAAALAPAAVLVTNLFRDQLDRYGELDAVYRLIRSGLEELDKTILLLNADDPSVSHLGLELVSNPNCELRYYGLDFKQQADELENRDDSKPAQAAQVLALIDRALCPVCSTGLEYLAKSSAQLGLYHCPSCSYKRPDPDFLFFQSEDRRFFMRASDEQGGSASFENPLAGLYNAYNLASAAALASLCLPETPLSLLIQGAKGSQASFGRQERIPYRDGKSICFILVKNPAGYAESLHLVSKAEDLGGLAFLLNDNYPDGRDVSWIYDVPFEEIQAIEAQGYVISGTRHADLALRLDYWGLDLEKAEICEESAAADACLRLLDTLPANRCLYILPNYTALLHLRAGLRQRLGLSEAWVEEG
ncbi:MAG: MurT ligase domain-containing protein [Eubacteriales bacterium]|nr:MurT ligase domain-containing protein [Eubacteriales bacterium]